MNGSLYLVTAPTEEPVTLAEAKEHLRVDSATFANDITTYQTIVPGSHATAASYSLTGTGIQVGSYDVIVNLNAATCEGTVNVKIQESDDNATYSDWSGSAFTAITTSNDNAIQEIAYTGNADYIRVAAQVSSAASNFSVDIILRSLDSTEDDYISSLITASRLVVENYLGQSLVTQTWDYYFNDWPDTPFDIPFPPLQSVSYIHYTDSDLSAGTVATTVYRVDTKSYPGRINLGFGQSWPGNTLDTVNGFVVRFVSGYGSAGNVRSEHKHAIKLLVAHYYENRENVSNIKLNELPYGYEYILQQERIISFA